MNLILAGMACLLFGFTASAVANQPLLQLQDSAACAAHNGKQVVLVHSGGDQTLTVWVDRWFMGIQTADHTKHILMPQEVVALGCTLTNAGEQAWTVSSVN